LVSQGSFTRSAHTSNTDYHDCIILGHLQYANIGRRTEMLTNEKKTLALHPGKKNRHIALGFLLINSITITYILNRNDFKPLNE
jgi:hypothetical protein